MKKDVFYFPHDSNAKDDPKCVYLIEQLGLEGYGIFWMLIETLREQSDYKYPINLIPALARRYNTTAEKVRAVIFSYELFKVEMDVFFYSESLNNRMQLINNKRAKARESINKRWEKYERNMNVLPTNNERNTSKVKKSKVNNKENNIKEKANRFSSPSILEVENYFIDEKNINPDNAKQYANNFILFYESKNWYVGKNKMTNWRSAATRSLTWDNAKQQKNEEKSTYTIPD